MGVYVRLFLFICLDHKIRLYEKHGPRKQYFLKRALDVPYVGWSILDVVVSPDGRDIVYSTWNEAMYQVSISEDDLNGDDENWIPLRVEATEARYSNGFSLLSNLQF